MNPLAAWRAWSRFQRRAPQWRRITFFAESRQDWHHFAPLVRELTGAQGRDVAYLTSDAGDFAFAHASPRFAPFHVPTGWARTLSFKTLQTDVLVLTMMDLGNFELQRSAHPVHYLYVFHSLGSTHMVDNEDSYDHYDTILCAGPHQQREIRRREELAGLVPKRLLEHGYHRLEGLIEGARAPRPARPAGDPPTVLIAPTWGPSSIFAVCGEPLVDILLGAGLRVIARPHYETLRQTPEVAERVRARFAGHARFEYIDQMGESNTLFRSDLLISDWSAMSAEYALGLARPVLFIDVPPRVRNPNYMKLGIEPLEVSLRSRVGDVLPVGALGEAPERIAKLTADPQAFLGRIAALREELVYNLGSSAEVGARHIAAIADEQAHARAQHEPHAG